MPRSKTRMTPELMWELGRLGDVSISPDGAKIAYTVGRFALEKNSGSTTLRIIDVESATDIPVVEGWESIAAIQWWVSEDQQRVFFEGKQASSDGERSLSEKSEDASDNEKGVQTQAWFFATNTNRIVQVTSIEGGISNLKLSPDGKRIAFTKRVKMKSEVKDIYPDLPKANARIIDSLMYRHWNAWDDYNFSHIHIAELASDGPCGEAFDLMAGIEADCPVGPFGGSAQFDWSPDGMEIAFTMKLISDGVEWAQSTDSNVYVIAAQSGAKPKKISNEMAGYDRNPRYSPDGRFIAFSSMQRPGFESDRARVMIFDRASEQIFEATRGLDQNAHQTIWTPDSKSILFTSEIVGTQQVFQRPISISEDQSQPVKTLTAGRYHWSIVAVDDKGSTLYAKRSDMLRPEELYKIDVTGGTLSKVDSPSFAPSQFTASQITTINDSIFEDLELPIVKERFVEATDGQKVHTWVIYPVGFDPADSSAEKKTQWPMLLYCQGGPQAQVGQSFSWRWNFHLMAAQGYVIAAPNRRGLPGFGQAWNDQISGDWGGQAMQDLLCVTDNVAAEPYIDNSKLAAVGASFGGYSIYWLMGHHENRFSAMIAHCGVFNLESMYGSTEELFFVNWDMGGPYWANSELEKKYRSFSPHQFVKNWNTPLLVIHGQQDFRVPVTQGMEAFTAAKVQNVPSRFLYFPEEGHWVTSPQNSVLWHRVFFDWLNRYCAARKSN